MSVNFLFSALGITKCDASMIHFDKFDETFKVIDIDEAYLSNFKVDTAI